MYSRIHLFNAPVLQLTKKLRFRPKVSFHYNCYYRLPFSLQRIGPDDFCGRCRIRRYCRCVLARARFGEEAIYPTVARPGIQPPEPIVPTAAGVHLHQATAAGKRVFSNRITGAATRTFIARELNTKGVSCMGIYVCVRFRDRLRSART